MASTVADVMVATLKAAEVQRVYGIPGRFAERVHDAIAGTEDRLGARTYEEAAAFAAAGEATLTGELAVCAASCGPGDLQLINALFDANRGGVRCWRSPRTSRVWRSAGVLPGDPSAGTVPRCSVYCESASVPAQLPRLMEIADPRGPAAPRVAVVVAPARCSSPTRRTVRSPIPVRAVSPVMRPDEGSLAAAAQVLNTASPVTILAGAGCAGRRPVIGLAER